MEALCEKVFLSWLTGLDDNAPSVCATLISLSTLATLATCSHFFFVLASAICFFSNLLAVTSEEDLWDLGRSTTPRLFIF